MFTRAWRRVLGHANYSDAFMAIRAWFLIGQNDHLGRDSTLSSVYVTKESHEKRMRVADQCALHFAGSFTPSIFNP